MKNLSLMKESVSEDDDKVVLECLKAALETIPDGIMVIVTDEG